MLFHREITFVRKANSSIAEAPWQVERNTFKVQPLNESYVASKPDSVQVTEHTVIIGHTYTLNPAFYLYTTKGEAYGFLQSLTH